MLLPPSRTRSDRIVEPTKNRSRRATKPVRHARPLVDRPTVRFCRGRNAAPIVRRRIFRSRHEHASVPVALADRPPRRAVGIPQQQL